MRDRHTSPGRESGKLRPLRHPGANGGVPPTDRLVLEQLLGQAEARIEAGRRRIERMSNIIRQSRTEGVDAEGADLLLRQFKYAYRAVVVHRDLILSLLQDQDARGR